MDFHPGIGGLLLWDFSCTWEKPSLLYSRCTNIIMKVASIIINLDQPSPTVSIISHLSWALISFHFRLHVCLLLISKHGCWLSFPGVRVPIWSCFITHRLSINTFQDLTQLVLPLVSHEPTCYSGGGEPLQSHSQAALLGWACLRGGGSVTKVTRVARRNPIHRWLIEASN